MAELNHIIEFEVGDYSHDGHNMSEVVLIRSNYSGKEIDKGFEQLGKQHNIDFQNICEEYEDSVIHEDDVKKLIELGSMTDENLEDGEYDVNDARELAEIALETLKAIIPDFEYEFYSIPNKEYCNALTGIGYGCFCC